MPNTPIALPESVLPNKKNKSIHFIGIGGIGMSGIAKIFTELNYKISGSDIKDSPTLFSMSERGATVFVGHHEKNTDDAGLLVVSSAIDKNNPEILKAQKNNIPIVHRAQVLSLLTSGKAMGQITNQVSIGVTGTHGKTTTSGMLGWFFENSQLSPTIVVGGQMPSLNTNSKLGSGQYFIAELDESDGTIVLYKPDITVITNLELDHPDHYRNGMDQLIDTFLTYINNLPDKATVIVNVDSEGNRILLDKIPQKNSKVLTYSIDPDSPYYENAKFKAANIKTHGFKSTFNVLYDNEPLGEEVTIIIPGYHNISNAIAAIAVGIESGLGVEKVFSSIGKFSGMKRRFQIIGESEGTKIVDDYAHHPTEIEAALSTAKSIIQSEGKGRLVAVFQPHRYSRLKTFWEEFKNCFKHADAVYVCDVYAASEKAIEGVNSEEFTKGMDHTKAKYTGGSLEEVAATIYQDIQPDDLVITLGAGNITKFGNILLEKIRKN
ncbi:MAG: UDP-N-acetylmuramate--L-alanine ligase [Vampirovibrionia bacterium]